MDCTTSTSSTKKILHCFLDLVGESRVRLGLMMTILKLEDKMGGTKCVTAPKNCPSFRSFRSFPSFLRSWPQENFGNFGNFKNSSGPIRTLESFRSFWRFWSFREVWVPLISTDKIHVKRTDKLTGHINGHSKGMIDLVYCLQIASFLMSSQNKLLTPP